MNSLWGTRRNKGRGVGLEKGALPCLSRLVTLWVQPAPKLGDACVFWSVDKSYNLYQQLREFTYFLFSLSLYSCIVHLHFTIEQVESIAMQLISTKEPMQPIVFYFVYLIMNDSIHSYKKPNFSITKIRFIIIYLFYRILLYYLTRVTTSEMRRRFRSSRPVQRFHRCRPSRMCTKAMNFSLSMKAILRCPWVGDTSSGCCAVSSEDSTKDVKYVASVN